MKITKLIFAILTIAVGVQSFGKAKPTLPAYDEPNSMHRSGTAQHPETCRQHAAEAKFEKTNQKPVQQTVTANGKHAR
jgi:hypothetical protein